jgi:hypothetical protein
MTEHEWLSSTDPQAMLSLLRQQDNLTERKLRLFAVACCRNVWHWLANPRIEYPGEQEAVAIAERYADGLASAEDLGAAAALTRRNAECQAWGSESLYAALAAAAAAAGVETSVDTAWEAARWSAAAAETDYGGVGAVPYPEDYQLRAGLIRDIFGTPFRPPPLISASLLTSNDCLIKRLAEAAYEHRVLPSGQLAPERLAVLADALEEAGADAGLVDHLRQPGPHARGCFAVDLLMGRE